MPFAFTARNDTADQVRRIALEQVEKALRDAREVDGGVDATVHRVRRRAKRVRGLLRLVKPSFEAYARENAVVRDAGRKLSGRRDAIVVQETFEGLLIAGHLVLAEDGLSAVRVSLLDNAGTTEAGADVLGDFAGLFAALSERIPEWRINGRGFGVINDGLEANYRRFRRAMARARSSGRAEDLHEWRKAAKYHWHHVTLLERAAPEVLGANLKTLDDLGERLGDHHNLHVLAERIEASELPPAVKEAAQAAIGKRQNDLAKAAFALGSQLAAERPEALRDRFAAYWKLLRED